MSPRVPPGFCPEVEPPDWSPASFDSPPVWMPFWASRLRLSSAEPGASQRSASPVLWICRASGALSSLSSAVRSGACEASFEHLFTETVGSKTSARNFARVCISIYLVAEPHPRPAWVGGATRSSDTAPRRTAPPRATPHRTTPGRTTRLAHHLSQALAPPTVL